MADPLALPGKPAPRLAEIKPEVELDPRVKAAIAKTAETELPEVQTFAPTAVSVKTLSIDPKDIPSETTQENIPTKPHWGGVSPNAPFDSIQIGHITFQKVSFNLVNGQQANQKLGMLMHLSPDQVDKIREQSTKVAWRRSEIKKKVGKEVKIIVNWDRIELTRLTERLMPGDKLTAHFVYLGELPRGQKVPVGVMDEEGRPLPTPDPLIHVKVA